MRRDSSPLEQGRGVWTPPSHSPPRLRPPLAPGRHKRGRGSSWHRHGSSTERSSIMNTKSASDKGYHFQTPCSLTCTSALPFIIAFSLPFSLSPPLSGKIWATTLKWGVGGGAGGVGGWGWRGWGVGGFGTGSWEGRRRHDSLSAGSSVMAAGEESRGNGLFGFFLLHFSPPERSVMCREVR